MKSLTICLAVSFLFLQNTKSQDSLQLKKEKHHSIYKATFFLLQGQTMKANLMAIKDSSVFVYQKSLVIHDRYHRNIYDESQWEKYNYKFIEGIKVNSKKTRSWLIPTSIVTGIIAGALIGKSTATNGSDLESGYSAIGSVFLGAILGGGIGTLAGFVISSSLDRKYLINGDWKSLEELKASLKY